MTSSDAKTLLEYIRKSGYKPNEWELKFIQTIEFLIGKGYKMTVKQSQALNKLYSKSAGDSMYQKRQYV